MARDVAGYIANRARELRVSRGWSLCYAAQRIGCTKTHIWEIEKGRSPNPTLKTLQGIAAAYGISVAGLISAKEDKAP